jgi:hypothetical protein
MRPAAICDGYNDNADVDPCIGTTPAAVVDADAVATAADDDLSLAFSLPDFKVCPMPPAEVDDFDLDGLDCFAEEIAAFTPVGCCDDGTATAFWIAGSDFAAAWSAAVGVAGTFRPITATEATNDSSCATDELHPPDDDVSSSDVILLRCKEYLSTKLLIADSAVLVEVVSRRPVDISETRSSGLTLSVDELSTVSLGPLGFIQHLELGLDSSVLS